MKKMFQIIALMLLVVSCSKNEEQELGNVKVKFTNKTGFTIQNLVISGKTIGTLNKGNTTEYIHFKTFGFDSGMPDVDCKGKIEGKTIEGIDKFYFCGTEKSKVEEGTYEINIILVSLNGKQYFQLNTSKTDSDDISLNSSDLQGNWEWISSCGGIGGTTSTPKSTGVRQSIHIGSDVICFYKSDNPISAMTFTIETKKSIYDHKERPIMVLFGGFDKSFEIKGDILTLYDEVYDGFTHHYKRHPARGCTKEYKHLIVKVKDEKGNPIALDKMKVTRLDTNEDITSHFVGNEWNVYQKWGSYPFYSDDFVEKDKDKSLTINFKGYIKKNKVIDTDVVVSADDCHVLYIRGKTDFQLNTSKTDSDDISLNSSDLQGKWEWISSYGGIGGTTSTPKSTGVRQSIHIGRDIICFYKSDNPISAMTFTIETKKSIYDHKERPMIALFGGISKSFEIKGDILTLFDEVYDGFTHHYKRTKHPARACTEVYKHLIVKVKDEKGNPIALDKMKVTRLDTNEDITSHFVGNEWNVYQKWGSYPFYSDDFVEKDKDKSLTINFKGYIKENKVIDTDVVVSADDCHVLYIRGKTDFVLD